MIEAWRYRRTAYSSGRKELVGYEKQRFGGPSRKVRKKSKGLFGTGFRSSHRWRYH